jgi:hypothetical protein
MAFGMYVPATCPFTATARATAQQEEAPMNTATVTTAPTVSPFIQNLQQQQPQKSQTSKEAIAANVKALIEQLEEGHSEGLTAYLTAMGRFHNYSFGNILEIARQKPSATRVAGMYAWNQLGRRVNKGEKGGLMLSAPVPPVRPTAQGVQP